jgi:hypothetical protein
MVFGLLNLNKRERVTKGDRLLEVFSATRWPVLWGRSYEEEGFFEVAESMT